MERSVTQMIDRLTEESAEESQTAGEFQRKFEAKTRWIAGTDGVSAGGDLEASLQGRRTLIARAVSGREGRGIERKEDRVLGTSPIGGGEQGIRLNTRIFRDLRTEDDVEEIITADEHERGHSESVQLRGRLLLAGTQQMTAAKVRHLLYEGYAEIRGREGAGQSIDGYRRGQPRETYREGQDLVLSLIHRTSRARVEELMTGHGDLARFQQENFTGRQ